MASERVELPIGEVCNVKQGRYLAPGEMSETQTDDAAIPVIGANGILGYTDRPSYSVPVTLVTCRGSNCGLIQRTKGPAWISNNAMACPPKPPHDSLYLHYVLSSIDYADVTTGSAQPQITTGHLNTKRITITRDPNEQNAIARILGALDDKIELNRRMNATLEAMARALFQSWFVDFDPVHAKAAGRQPSGMDAPTAALFPAAFQDSALGEIPMGWSVQRIEDLADRVAMGPFGSNIKRENFVESGVPVIRGGNLTDGFVDQDFVYVTESKAKELQNSIAHRGDLVFTHRGTLGQVGLIHEDATFSRYIVSQSQMLLRIRRGALSSEAVYQFFRSSAGQQALLANTSQTGVPAISRPTTSLKAIQLVVPPPDVSSRFEQLVAPIRRQFSNNTAQSRTLATLRDTLLPKLLSGELSVQGSTN